mgnify:CR=1 FL=1
MGLMDFFVKKDVVTEDKSSKIIDHLNSMATTFRRSSIFSGFAVSPDGKRNYNMLFGYGDDLSYSDFYALFKRGGFANAVVSKIAKACWRDPPVIRVGQKEVLKEELLQLKRNGLFRAFERADILNRIGPFSVLVVMVPDGRKLSDPLGSAKDLSSINFHPYGYDAIEIVEWDSEPSSPRYGLPLRYNLQIVQKGKKDMTTITRIVHWSRIVHMAEGCLDSRIEGLSCLEPIWNSLLDIEKIRGASSEAAFRNARQKFALEAGKDARLATAPTDLAAAREEVESFTNGQQDFMRLSNMTARVMQPGLASPRDAFDIAVEEVSGETGIPIRILTGKGGGQLAGSEDRASWNSLVVDRQESVCTEHFIRFLEILSISGMIKLPDDYDVIWPVRASLNTMEVAESQFRRGQAINHIMTAITSPAGVMVDLQSILEELHFDKIQLTGKPRPDIIDSKPESGKITTESKAKDNTSDES